MILVRFLEESEASSAPRTFVIRNKPTKVKIKSMFLRHMFPPQILMLDWRIIGSIDVVDYVGNTGCGEGILNRSLDNQQVVYLFFIFWPS